MFSVFHIVRDFGRVDLFTYRHDEGTNIQKNFFLKKIGKKMENENDFSVFCQMIFLSSQWCRGKSICFNVLFQFWYEVFYSDCSFDLFSFLWKKKLKYSLISIVNQIFKPRTPKLFVMITLRTNIPLNQWPFWQMTLRNCILCNKYRLWLVTFLTVNFSDQRRFWLFSFEEVSFDTIVVLSTVVRSTVVRTTVVVPPWSRVISLSHLMNSQTMDK